VPEEEARALRLLQQTEHDFRLLLLVVIVVVLGGGGQGLVGQFGLVVFFIVVQRGDAKAA
jgi:hypothetical protein